MTTTETGSDRGTFYRGRLGMWLYIGHRIGGIALFGFLLLHILDTATILMGPEVYDGVEEIYHTFFFRLMEIGLMATILLHAVNGLRITVIDFWSKGAEYEQQLNLATVIVFLVVFIPTGIWMFVNFFRVG